MEEKSCPKCGSRMEFIASEPDFYADFWVCEKCSHEEKLEKKISK